MAEDHVVRVDHETWIAVRERARLEERTHAAIMRRALSHYIRTVPAVDLTPEPIEQEAS